MSTQRTIIVNDVGPAGTLVIPVQPGGTVIMGYCGTGKSITLEAIALGLGGKEKGRVSPRNGTKRGSVDCLGVLLNVSAGRVTQTGDLEVASNEDFCLGALIDPPVKDDEARNRHGIKSLLRMTKAEAKPDLFYHLTGGKAAFEKIVPPDATKSADLVDMAARVKRALEARSREQTADAEREEAAAAADRNAGDGLDLSQETDGRKLQQDLETAAGEKAALDEQARAAKKARAAAEEARKALATATGDTQSIAEYEANQNALKAEYEAAREQVKELEQQLGLARVTAQAAFNQFSAAEDATAAAQRTLAATAGWQSAIDAAAGVDEPSVDDLVLVADVVQMARRALETAAVVRAAKERIAKAKAHQERAAEHRKEAARLRDAAKDTDSVLSAAVASERFSVAGGILMGVLPDAEAKPFYDLSDGERTLIATAEKVDRVRAAEPDPDRLGIVDLPQRTFQDLPGSVRNTLFARAAERNVCVVTAQVDEGPLRALVWTPEGVVGVVVNT